MKEKITMFVVGLVGAALLCWLIWQGMLLVPANAARLWAILATAALVPAGAIGWYLGRVEVHGRLAGIDQAIDKVMGAATRAAGLRVETSRALHRVHVEQPQVVVLPDVEIIQRRLPSGSNMIEL